MDSFQAPDRHLRGGQTACRAQVLGASVPKPMWDMEAPRPTLTALFTPGRQARRRV